MALLPAAQMHNSPPGSFVLLTLGVIGVFGVEGISVSYYLALMGGEKGLGIAVINMLGALGGFVGSLRHRCCHSSDRPLLRGNVVVGGLCSCCSYQCSAGQRRVGGKVQLTAQPDGGDAAGE